MLWVPLTFSIIASIGSSSHSHGSPSSSDVPHPSSDVPHPSSDDVEKIKTAGNAGPHRSWADATANDRAETHEQDSNDDELPTNITDLPRAPPQRHGTIFEGVGWDDSLRSDGERITHHGAAQRSRESIMTYGSESEFGGSTKGSAANVMQRSPSGRGAMGKRISGGGRTSHARLPTANSSANSESSIHKWLQVRVRRILGEKYVSLLPGKTSPCSKSSFSRFCEYYFLRSSKTFSTR